MVIWKHSLTQSICALYLTKDPKLKVFVWFQYLKTVLHISVLNFFTFFFFLELTACTGQKGSFLSRVSSSLSFHPVCFVVLSPHTPNVRTRFCGFFFYFSFSTLLPSYPEDQSPANRQLDFCWWVPFLSLFYGLWWTRFALLPLSRKNP